MTLWKWLRTPAPNANADTTINWAEGQPPSSVNDSARAMMAAVAKYRDDISGALATAGTGTAYTVTSYQGFDTLAHLDGQIIAFTPGTGNGSPVTLNVDGLGAKQLRSAPNVELQTGALITGTPYLALYNNSDGVFYLHGASNYNSYSIPLGGLLPYIGASAPNSAFALPFGQAISRGAYATLFSLIGTTFGSGDGSSTFNLPDIRGRVIAGLDNMGGSSASRLSSAFASTSMGSTGGAQNQTVAQANLPNVTLTTNIDEHGGHRHFTFASDQGYGPNYTGTASGFVTAGGAGAPVTASNIIGLGYVTGLQTTGITASTPLGGSGTALTTTQPTMVANYILRIV